MNDHAKGATMFPFVQQYLKKYRPLTALTLLSTGLLLMVLSLGLVACGSSTGSGNAPTPTPTTQTQAQKCGTVQTTPRGIPLDITKAKKASDCFWQAYQKCAPASLVYTLTGVDTVKTRTFAVQRKNGYCTVSDAVRFAIVPAPLSTAKTYTCTGVAQMPDGLHFSGCGDDGDVVVSLQAA
jgi:hypothetical protein